MRRLLLPAAGFAAMLACEQRFSATPPVMTPGSAGPAASSGALEALLSPPGFDAGPAPVEVSRALTITLCSASSVPCASPDDASSEASYRVVYGSGRAEIRSRGQAMTDLYKELRDRLASGERLDAVARAPRQAGGAFSAGNGTAMKAASADSSDATSRCAFHLLDLVDGVGEVTVEVMPRFAATGCLVSLGRPMGDAGIPHCLIAEPERPGRKGS
jgi:hypothetical protein